MADNSTSVPSGEASLHYREGDVIVFKYEGNLRATVMGCLIIDGKQWLEAHCQCMELFVPCTLVAGVESKEEG